MKKRRSDERFSTICPQSGRLIRRRSYFYSSPLVILEFCFLEFCFYRDVHPGFSSIAYARESGV